MDLYTSTDLSKINTSATPFNINISADLTKMYIYANRFKYMHIY